MLIGAVVHHPQLSDERPNDDQGRIEHCCTASSR
jgi:hypothetical protein